MARMLPEPRRDDWPERTGPRQILWFIGLWGLGVLAVWVVALLIRLAMGL